MPDYIGRFAPSPTGPLHFGSLVTAVASYLDAKAADGKWLVRMEDLDPPREMSGAADSILKTLEIYHLFWDGDVWFQSKRHDAYKDAIDRLLKQGQAFFCTCSRKNILKELNGIYPGTCRKQLSSPPKPSAIRLKTQDITTGFLDGIQGEFRQNLNRDIGDFIIKRKDNLYAYHLAAVVDDHAQGITHIIRGLDLLDSTPRHLYLQQCLAFTHPHYYHLPLITNNKGQKLSKQSFAPPIPSNAPSFYLWHALQALGQHPPAELLDTPPTDILLWGKTHWKQNNIPHVKTITDTKLFLDV